ncbi:MAG: AAA family ATPase [Candidatus Promineifilaceae bacterium]|nr:AAA family ATPase [Candidatus Promineifilaceae bacterium]
MRVDMPDEKLALYLLGSPRVAWQDASLQIVRRQARALLYRIAADPAAVARERLAFLFWPDEPDARARRNLSRLLSYLRKELPDRDCLLVDRRTVRLNPDRAWSDCLFLEEAHDSGDQAALEKGADLYRGRFLEGFFVDDAPEFAKWREQRAAELESAYLSLLSRLVTILSEQDEIEAAAGYARRYLSVDNLAEKIHRRLITLYGRAGDRAAATRQFERCTLLLERELGVDPLPETREAYQAALGDGASPLPIQARAPSWSVLPSLELPLVGRGEALQALENAAIRLGSGGLIVITGEAGVGKSRLLQTFARGSERRALAGNSHRGSHSVSYQPLLQAMRQALDAPHRWRDIPAIWRAEMARLLPELSHIFPDLPRPLDVAPQEAQSRLLEAVTRCLLGLGKERPILLCLDDLHWADGATLRWLIDLSGRFPDSRLLIAATARIADVEALADVKRTFQRVNRVVEIRLGGLTPAAITRALEEMALGLSEETRGRFAEQLHGATGGNTFFVLETVRTLIESDRLHIPADTFPLATTVEDAVRSRFERLSAVSQQLLQSAAVLAPDLTPDLLRQTAGRTELEVAGALDELVARQLLREEESGHTFNHDLVRMAVYRELTPWRRQLLHRRAAEAISAVHGDPALAELATIAHHFDAAGAETEAVHAYRRAAEAATAVYAYDEAVGYLRRAIALLPDSAIEPAAAGDLHELAGQKLAYSGRHEEARAAYRQALALHAAGDRLTIARLHERIAASHLAQLHYEKARRRLEQALSALEEASGVRDEKWQRLWLAIKLRFIYLHFCLYDVERCLSLLEEVAPVAERVGTAAQKSEVARERVSVAWLKDGHRPSAATVALAERQDERARKAQNPRASAKAAFHLGYARLFSDDPAAAEAPLLESLTRAEAVAHRQHEARCLALISTLYRQQGDRERAEAFARRALVAGRAVGSRHYQAHALATLAWLDYCDGKLEPARRRARQAATYFLETRAPFAWLALITLLAIRHREGQADTAIEAAATMLHPHQRRLPEPLTAPLEQAVAHWEAGNREQAGTSLEQAVASAQEIGYL